jgi:hypothetical protein
MKIKAKFNIHTNDIDNLENEDISVGHIYHVIGIEGEFYRIVNDANEPTLYPKTLFHVIDPHIPEDWVKTEYDGEIFIEPPETCKPGFYEDYFDGHQDRLDNYEKMLKKIVSQN